MEKKKFQEISDKDIVNVDSDNDEDSQDLTSPLPKKNSFKKITKKWSFHDNFNEKAEELLKRPSMRDMSKNDIYEFKKVFDLFDKDGDGKISRKDFKDLLKKLCKIYF
jgi:hypothetical protein